MTLLDQLYQLRKYQDNSKAAQRKYENFVANTSNAEVVLGCEDSWLLKILNVFLSLIITAVIWVISLWVVLDLAAIKGLFWEFIMLFVAPIIEFIIVLSIDAQIIEYIASKVATKKRKKEIEQWKLSNPDYMKRASQYYREWAEAYNKYKSYNFLGNQIGYLDLIIEKVSTGRAYSVKEALQLIDNDIANNRLRETVQNELARQTKAIENIKVNYHYEHNTNVKIDVH